MVDKALFLGTSGAKDAMHELSIVTNNLANSTTSGFRADFETAKTKQLGGDNATRAYSVPISTYSDMAQGAVINTKRELDVALAGPGFIAVQSKSGQEAYTRAGDLQIKDGKLTTATGNLVMSPSGVIDIPVDSEHLDIGVDGTISVKIKGQADSVTLNQIKLVNPPAAQMQKGKDGLFYLPQGAVAKQDDSLRLSPGYLEGSNVNAVDMMTRLIDLSRQFDMHSTMMKTVKDNATKANELLALPK